MVVVVVVALGSTTHCGIYWERRLTLASRAVYSIVSERKTMLMKKKGRGEEGVARGAVDSIYSGRRWWGRKKGKTQSPRATAAGSRIPRAENSPSFTHTHTLYNTPPCSFLYTTPLVYINSLKANIRTYIYLVTLFPVHLTWPRKTRSQSHTTIEHIINDSIWYTYTYIWRRPENQFQTQASPSAFPFHRSITPRAYNEHAHVFLVVCPKFCRCKIPLFCLVCAY